MDLARFNLYLTTLFHLTGARIVLSNTSVELLEIVNQEFASFSENETNRTNDAEYKTRLSTHARNACTILKLSNRNCRPNR